MNKLLLTLASLMFFNTNIYAQDQRSNQQTRYTYNNDNKVEKETTVKFDSTGTIIKEITTWYNYYNCEISNKNTTTKAFDINGQVSQEIVDVIFYRYPTGEITRDEFTINTFISGAMRPIFESSDITNGNKEVTEKKYDATGELLQTTIREYNFVTMNNQKVRLLDCSTVIKYSKEEFESTNITESKITFFYKYDPENLLTVTATVKDETGELLELRSYSFSRDFSVYSFEINIGPWLSKAEQKTEADLIISFL